MNQTLVLSAADANRIILPYKYAHISIQDPGSPEWPLSSDPNRIATLRLWFHDQRGKEPNLPKPDDVAPAIMFVLDWKERVEGFVVNCAAGISRSAGLAAGIAEMLGLDERPYYEPPKNPNPVVRDYVRAVEYIVWRERYMGSDGRALQARLAAKNAAADLRYAADNIGESVAPPFAGKLREAADIIDALIELR